MTDVQTAPTAGRPRNEAREQAILDAVVEIVAEVGYDRLTVDGVATRARASKATIYRRWPGKSELVLEAFRRRLPQPIEIADLGSLRAELLDGMRELCSHIAGMDGSLLCGLAGACHSDPGLAACFKQLMNEKQSPLRDVIARAVARGELPAGSTHDLVEEITPAVALMRSLRNEPLDPAFVDHLVDDIALALLGVTDPVIVLPTTPTASPTTPPTGGATRLAKESR
jgi:AcrR family transcriptional regulator